MNKISSQVYNIRKSFLNIHQKNFSMNSNILFDSMNITETLTPSYKRQKISFDLKLHSKKSSSNDNDDLFVFGYGCKLFRDDTLALKIETDAYLIPWNGDQGLLIDRYDCRGHLYDLSEYDNEISSKLSTKIANEEDEEIEKLCDEERYHALNKLLEEEELKQEEELKRFYQEQSEYGAVSYKYEEKQVKNELEIKKDTKEEETKLKVEAFVPSNKLQLPEGMLIPETRKLNSIIEKTASFVAKQGLPMEILIKTKQSSNPQFAFLELDHTLNPYYKHIVNLIKTCKYEPMLSNENSSSNDSMDDDDDDDDDLCDGNYLHPLLAKGLSSQKSNDSDTQFKPCIKDSPLNKLIQKFALQSSKAKDTSSQVEAQDESVVPKIIEPTASEVKQIIDKLADYVIRNGQEFEENIRAKKDARFEFLNETHEYFAYYKSRVQSLKPAHSTLVEDVTIDDLLENNSSKSTISKEKQAERKAKAALFLNKIASNETHKKQPRLSRSRSRSHRRKHKHRSRSRRRGHRSRRTRSRSLHKRRRKQSSRSRSRHSRKNLKKRHRSSRSNSRHKHKKQRHAHRRHKSRSKSPVRAELKKESSVSSTSSSDTSSKSGKD